MLLPALLLSLFPPPLAEIDDVPASVLTSLSAAQVAREQAARCLEAVPRPTLQPRAEALGLRMYDAAVSVRGLWATPVEPDPRDLERRPKCSMAAVRQALDRAASALDAFDRAFAAATAPFGSGVWIGVLRLCRARTLSATVEEDGHTGQPMLTIRLDAQAAAHLAALTGRATGGPLAVRLDGVVVMRPTIFEPILQGEMRLNGPDTAVLERVRLALDRPC